MRIPLDQLSPVLRVNLYEVEICLRTRSRLDPIPVNIHEKPDELFSGQKIRKYRNRKHISDLIRQQHMLPLIITDQSISHVWLDLITQTIK